MGIRIHKALGWGLSDVQPGTDPRVNWGAEPFRYEGRAGAEYAAWVEENSCARQPDAPYWFTLDRALLSSRSPEAERFRAARVWESVTYSPEYGMPEVLVIRPFTQREWSRFDDAIDFAAESVDHPGAENRCQPVRGGIFPHTGLFMDAETGENLPHGVIEWVRVRNAIADQGRDPDEMDQALMKLAAQLTPYATRAEADARIVPRVPEEIRDVAAFLRLFTGDTVWRQLRPLLYTYWA